MHNLQQLVVFLLCFKTLLWGTKSKYCYEKHITYLINFVCFYLESKCTKN